MMQLGGRLWAGGLMLGVAGAVTAQGTFGVATPLERDAIRPGIRIEGRAAGPVEVELHDLHGRRLAGPQRIPASGGRFSAPLSFQPPPGMMRGTLVVFQTPRGRDGRAPSTSVPISFQPEMERRAKQILQELRAGDVSLARKQAHGGTIEVVWPGGNATVRPTARSLAPLIRWARSTQGASITRTKVTANRHTDGYNVTGLALSRGGYFYVGAEFEGRITKLFASRQPISWD